MTCEHTRGPMEIFARLTATGMSLGSRRGRCVSIRRARGHCLNLVLTSVYTIRITAVAFSRACGVFLATIGVSEHLDGMGPVTMSATKMAVRVNLILENIGVSFQDVETQRQVKREARSHSRCARSEANANIPKRTRWISATVLDGHPDRSNGDASLSMTGELKFCLIARDRTCLKE